MGDQNNNNMPGGMPGDAPVADPNAQAPMGGGMDQPVAPATPEPAAPAMPSEPGGMPTPPAEPAEGGMPEPGMGGDTNGGQMPPAAA